MLAYSSSMYKGMYIALSGSVVKQTQMEVITQNLANADSAGFKRDTISFEDYLIPKDTYTHRPDGRSMSTLSSMKTDFAAGGMVSTGSPLDIAVDGSGFIALEGNRYTRRGDLKMDSEGYLISHDGIRVLGTSGPVQLPQGRIEINDAGDIMVDGVQTATLKITDFERPETMVKSGSGMFVTDEEGTPSKSLVKQGFLEKSNVNIIQEMVRMIETLREFESFQRMIRSFDEATAKITNELGRA